MTGVFHHIGTPSQDHFTNSLEQILAYEGEVTFDGIYTSVYEHREALKDRKPLLFITGNQIGEQGYCTREQLEEMKQLGFILAWHGWTHRRLTELSEAEIQEELTKPDWVEPFYAYPHGDFNDLSKQLLEDMGYVAGYSTTQGDGSQYALYRQYI